MYELVGGDTSEEGFDIYELKDEERGIQCEIFPISNEYMLLILQNFMATVEEITPDKVFSVSIPYYNTKLLQKQCPEKYDLFTNLRVLFNSIKIQSEKPANLSILNKIANSFSFKCAYSTNQPVILLKNLDRKYIQSPMPDFTDYDVQVPNEHLKNDPLYYYQMA